MKKCYSSSNQAARSEQQRYVSQKEMTKKHKKAEKPPLYHTIMMNYSEVPLSLGFPMPYCN